MAKLRKKLEKAALKAIFLKNIIAPSYVEIANAIKIQKTVKYSVNAVEEETARTASADS